jgi:hypothetical protein
MEHKLTVIGFSDDQVIFENKTKDLIYWPKNQLPLVPEIGEQLTFSINSQKADTSPRELINELLKINTEENK